MLGMCWGETCKRDLLGMSCVEEATEMVTGVGQARLRRGWLLVIGVRGQRERTKKKILIQRKKKRKIYQA